MNTKSILNVLLVLMSSLAIMSCSDDKQVNNDNNDPKAEENTPELCTDKIDNDNNGKIDCDDESCQSFDVCNSLEPEDETCQSPDSCNQQSPETEELCTSVKENCDNDQEDCIILVPCLVHPEITDDQEYENTPEKCKDTIDNDNNGKIDCDDESCRLLSVCEGWQTAENTQVSCSDGEDNDGDLEIDCEDAECAAYCNDDDDPDWTVEGAFCKASEIGMIKDSTENADRGHNFLVLKKFMENSNDYECNNLELDGEYHLMPVTKEGGAPIENLKYVYITLDHMVKIKGGTLDFGEYYNGFRLKPKGGMVIENSTIISNPPSRGYAIFDGYYDTNRYHGTADRLMFRNVDLKTKSLFKIHGVHKRYNEETQKYNGPELTKEEIEEYSTRIKRITIKNCTGSPIGSLSDMGVIHKYEIIDNDFSYPDLNTLIFAWGTDNDFKISTDVNFQGNSHVIFRNNKIKGADDVTVLSSTYAGVLLLETKKVNYEDNHIENIMVRGKVTLDETTGEPKEIKSAPVYDSYLSSTQVIARNNTIKNVIPIISHYNFEGSYYNELMKSKSAPECGLPKIRRYENNTYIIEESAVMKNLNRLLDGGSFADGTTVNPMYVSDDNGGKRKLNASERATYIKNNSTWGFFNGVGLNNMQEVTINNNKIEMDGLYLIGTWVFPTRQFTAIGNQIKVKTFRNNYHHKSIFTVTPYKYTTNQNNEASNFAFAKKNESLHTNIEIRNNTLSVTEPPIWDDIDVKRMKLKENSEPLLNIHEYTSAKYVDEEGTEHKVEFDYGELVIENNITNNDLNLYTCEGSDYWKLKCNQNE